MVVKRKLFKTPAKHTNAKRLKALERKVATNATEVEVQTAYSNVELRSTSGGSAGTLNGVLNNVPTSSNDGRNYKTVSVKASLAQDEALLSGDLYRYRMILWSNKNDSGRDNTVPSSGDFPLAYGSAAGANTLDFFIDEKRFTVYDDKMQRNIVIGAAPQTQPGLGTLMVQQTFRTPKLVRFGPNIGSNQTHGCIGLTVYRQNLTTGVVERVQASSVDAPLIVSEHKWIDP